MNSLQSHQKPSRLWICDGMSSIARAQNRIMVRGFIAVHCRKMHSWGFWKTWNPNWYTAFISQWIPGKKLVKKKNAIKSCIFRALIFALLTSAALIHFSSSRALCWLPSVVGRRQDAKTALANLLNWSTVARTDQQRPSLPFLSLWDHSEPRQWYGTRRTNSSWSVTVHKSIKNSLQTLLCKHANCKTFHWHRSTFCHHQKHGQA